MNYVESIEVSGFWGKEKVFVRFKDDVNFLLGANGSGKTTLINMLAATLRADVPQLYAAPFDSIFIKLKTIGANKKPSVLVEKITDPQMGSINLRFTIKESATGKSEQFGVEGPFDERIYRDARYARTLRFREQGARLSAILEKFTTVSWLSIHRISPDARRAQRDESFESTVDQKLHDISKTFASYFSLLAGAADQESKNFQEQVFLSLLQTETTLPVIFSQLNVQEEDKENLLKLLAELRVTPSRASRSVAAFQRRLAEAKTKYRESQQIRWEDAIILSDARRMQEMVAKWRVLQERRDEIYGPRSRFIEIINELFTGKTIEFDERNLPRVVLADGSPASIDTLSSGEKQLFILLGEALLQEQRPVVFISDEPELSLHVKWQSVLFKHIRALNSQCQVITATHSPDIVGRFQGRTIEMGSCFV